MEPTARGDYIAEKMREYYEANREGWWERFWRRVSHGAHSPATADDLMIGVWNAGVQAKHETRDKVYEEAERKYRQARGEE